MPDLTKPFAISEPAGGESMQFIRTSKYIDIKHVLMMGKMSYSGTISIKMEDARRFASELIEFAESFENASNG